MKISIPQKPVIVLTGDEGATLALFDRLSHYELTLKVCEFKDQEFLVCLSEHELATITSHLEEMAGAKTLGAAAALRLGDDSSGWLKVHYTNRGEPFREYVQFSASCGHDDLGVRICSRDLSKLIAELWSLLAGPR